MSPPRGLVAVRRRPPPPTRIPREDSGPASRVPCPPPALLCSPLRLLILKHVLPAPPSSVKAFVSKGQVQTRNSTSPGEAALTSRPNRAGPSARLSHFQLSHRGAGSVCFSPENAFCSVTNSIADVTQFVQQDADFFFNPNTLRHQKPHENATLTVYFSAGRGRALPPSWDATRN